VIVNERITDYLDSLSARNSDLTEKIREEAVSDRVPVIRRDSEALLKTVIAMVRPREVLEIGTGVAYSALVMKESMPEGSHITTVEDYPPRMEKAAENIRLSHAEDCITLIREDAGNVIPGLKEESFDLVFLDAAKGQYASWLPYLLKCLKQNGVLFSDNVLQNGSVTESRFAIDRRDRTIHSRMREYLYLLTHTEGLCTSVVPTGDGTAISVKGMKNHE
jgi:predicted O-methyltransferase YrrM